MTVVSNQNELVFIQATTTPYRTEFFNILNQVAIKNKRKVTVFYYKSMMGDREWSFDEDEMNHEYKIFNCFELFIKKYPFYFSFRLLTDLFRKKNSEIILGVSWNDFLVVLIIVLKKIKLLDRKLHFWIEANYLSEKKGFTSKIKKILRKKILLSIDGFLIIPGQLAKDTIHDYWGVDKEVTYLPNVIDVDYTNINLLDLKLDTINILIVARLIEEKKGIYNFLKNINESSLKKTTIYLAGDGPDKKIYEKYIDENNLSNIILLGNVDRKKLLSYYKSCDFFVLPSYSDPNPLSVIEALYAAKPLLISDRCGNKYEAVEEGCNGFVFSPTSPDDIRNKLDLMINNKNNFKKMGGESLRIANEKFDPVVVSKKLLNVI